MSFPRDTDVEDWHLLINTFGPLPTLEDGDTKISAGIEYDNTRESFSARDK
jgi:hypothetical protein